MSEGGSKFLHPLPVKDVSANGQVSVELGNLPVRSIVAGFIIGLEGTATAASSTSAFTPVTMAQLITNIDLDSDMLQIRLTGRAVHVLDRIMNGKPTASAAQTITATTGGVAAMGMLRLSLSDPRCADPDATAMPARLLRQHTLNFNFKSTLTLGLSPEVTMSAMKLRVFAQLLPENGDVIPVKQNIRWENWNQLTANLKAGHYTHLAIYDESDLAVTLAEYAQLTMQMDGENMYDRVQTPHFVAKYNQEVPRDQAMELSYQAAQNLDFLPLIFQPDKYKLTKVPECEQGLTVTIESGTATGATYIYRQCLPLRDAEGRATMLRLGHDPETSKVTVKTLSKEPLKGDEARVLKHARLLPKRLEK